MSQHQFSHSFPANQTSVLLADRPIKSWNRSPSLRPDFPGEGGRNRPSPAWNPVASGRPRGRFVLRAREREKQVGDSHVAAGGFTTFSFANDDIAKCVREAAAQPGPQREAAGPVSSPGSFAADGTGGRPRAPATRSGSAGSRPGPRSEGSREPWVVQVGPSNRSISGDPGLPRRCRPAQVVRPGRLRIRGWSRRISKAEVGSPGDSQLLSLWRRGPVTEAPSSNPGAAFSPYRKSDGLMTSWLAAER
ncbi:uncharacterized protein LOC111549123 [Piliocolobus tephrosceles]|uniref:uncharacterized protein LOC111549123 n=1 Tax=Piliocolobus tephrosceles TaxID=591936 RepID=UPI000C295B73|nr:uncharacterized protein LOC111549123 [Piliocolobus tephrosceles]